MPTSGALPGLQSTMRSPRESNESPPKIVEVVPVPSKQAAPTLLSDSFHRPHGLFTHSVATIFRLGFESKDGVFPIRAMARWCRLM